MNDQLTRCKNGKLKNFGYGFILNTFSLERVLILRPRHILANEGGSKDPHMMRWVALMACHGGDGPVMRYTIEFFNRLGQ